MVSQVDRERSGSELIFLLLKVLMTGYRLWGAQSGLELAGLPGFLRTSDTHVGGLLTYLAGEGLVFIDTASGTVRLSESGARHLLAEPRRNVSVCAVQS